jgi:hypothetical protein
MTKANALSPLPHHDQVVDALRDLEPELWAWFSSDAARARSAALGKRELLQSSRRLPRDGHGSLYALLDQVCGALGVEAPSTLHRAQGDGPTGARLVFVPSELHVVLRGAVLARFSAGELRARLGYEVGLHALFTGRAGELPIAGALLEDTVARGGAPSLVRTARRFRLWTSIAADRASLTACDDLATAIASLVKASTDREHVDGRAYLAKAEEELAASGSATPSSETALRALALRAWAEGGSPAAVERLVQGELSLDALDLVQQRDLTRATRELLDRVLEPTWMRTEATLRHARRFFPDLVPRGPAPAPPGASAAPGPLGALEASYANESLAEYVAYLLLDFAMIDPAIEEQGLGHAARLASSLGVASAFRAVTKKELNLSAAALLKLLRAPAPDAESGA